MSENITLEQLQTAQNEYIAAQTAKINSLEANTAAVLSAFSTLANRAYSYSHEAIVTDGLDAVYDSIIEDNPELAELSAVGFTALLSSGNVIPTQNNIMFINGTREETDYAFSGTNSADGIELVKVWYFENDGALTVEKVNANIIEVSVKSNQTVPAFSADFFNYADEIKTNINLLSAPLAVRKQKNVSGGSFADSISPQLESYESNCTFFPGGPSPMEGLTALRKVSFPELLEIQERQTNYGPFLNKCTGCTDISFPKLTKIGGGLYQLYNGPFDSVPYITVPATVTYIGQYSFRNNRTINLLCKDAETIDDLWCATTPSDQFYMCSDWGASINIAVAAARWTKEQFIDLFQNKLRDMDEDVCEIKIPTAIYDSLTDDEFALAEDQNWTVGA